MSKPRGKPPLGFQLNAQGIYVIAEHDAAAVRLIFALYTEGRGFADIQMALTAGGYHTQTGRVFSKGAIHRVLVNVKYTGLPVTDTLTDLPTIITPDLFAKAQLRRQQTHIAHNSGHYKARTIYLLSGLAYCGHCGTRLRGVSYAYNTRVTKAHRARFAYVCPRALTKRCTATRIAKEQLEETVLTQVRDTIFTKRAFPKLARSLLAQQIVRKTTLAPQELSLPDETSLVVLLQHYAEHIDNDDPFYVRAALQAVIERVIVRDEQYEIALKGREERS